MTPLYWIFGVATAVVLYVIFMYNRLVTLRYRAKEALSDIDVQLKRRFELIPNLVETVKGYLKHEQGVLENVTKARAAVAHTDGNPLARAESENMLSSTLKTLFAVSENYPDLKANANFLDLQRELADTENKIQAARRFYNAMARDLNTSIGSFPTSIIASTFHFKEEEFFEVESAQEKQPVKVSF